MRDADQRASANSVYKLLMADCNHRLLRMSQVPRAAVWARLVFYAEHGSGWRVCLPFGIVAQVPAKLELHSEVSDEL